MLKKHRKVLNRVAPWIAVAAAALLSGCAALGTATPEQLVQERSTARWKALVAGDLKTGYDMLAPSYRAVSSYERYTSGMGSVATWVAAEVLHVDCETAQKCTARVKIEAKPIAVKDYRGTISTGVDETWLLEDGEWWLYQKL